MKILAASVAAIVIGTGAWAGETGARQNPKVTVCIERGSDREVMDEARTIASRIFLRADVRIEWRSVGPRCPSDAIRISLSEHTPQGQLPGALAFALPYEGTHIEVFYDRVQNAVGSSELSLPMLLGHVLAHEITHILQGVSQHSDTGLMKARWDLRDYAEMRIMLLPLTPLDAELIHKNLRLGSKRGADALIATNLNPESR